VCLLFVRDAFTGDKWDDKYFMMSFICSKSSTSICLQLAVSNQQVILIVILNESGCVLFNFSQNMFHFYIKRKKYHVQQIHSKSKYCIDFEQ